jgi:hypothetical protein
MRLLNASVTSDSNMSTLSYVSSLSLGAAGYWSHTVENAVYNHDANDFDSAGLARSHVVVVGNLVVDSPSTLSTSVVSVRENGVNTVQLFSNGSASLENARVNTSLRVGSLFGVQNNAVQLGDAQILSIPESGRIQLGLNAPNKAFLFSSFPNSANAFFIDAGGTGSFTKIMAAEYEISSVSLNELVTARVSVDTVTTQRIGLAI